MAESHDVQGTAVTLAPSGGDVTWTLTSLADTAGRASGSSDLGATIPFRLGYRLTSAAGSAPTAGESLRLYVAWSDDGTNFDGEVTGSDAAFSDADEFAQLTFVRACPFDADTSAHSFGGDVRPNGRYVVWVVYNDLGVALSATAGNHSLTFWPLEPNTA